MQALPCSPLAAVVRSILRRRRELLLEVVGLELPGGSLDRRVEHVHVPLRLGLEAAVPQDPHADRPAALVVLEDASEQAVGGRRFPARFRGFSAHWRAQDHRVLVPALLLVHDRSVQERALFLCDRGDRVAVVALPPFLGGAHVDRGDLRFRSPTAVGHPRAPGFFREALLAFGLRDLRHLVGCSFQQLGHGPLPVRLRERVLDHAVASVHHVRFHPLGLAGGEQVEAGFLGSTVPGGLVDSQQVLQPVLDARIVRSEGLQDLSQLLELVRARPALEPRLGVLVGRDLKRDEDQADVLGLAAAHDPPHGLDHVDRAFPRLDERDRREVRRVDPFAEDPDVADAHRVVGVGPGQLRQRRVAQVVAACGIPVVHLVALRWPVRSLACDAGDVLPHRRVVEFLRHLPRRLPEVTERNARRHCQLLSALAFVDPRGECRAVRDLAD